MKDLKFEVVRGESIYSSDIEAIYHQNDKAHGGIFYDRCIIKDINKLARDYRKNIYIICAIKDGKVVGFAQLTDAYVPNSLYIAILAVEKEHRMQGIGKAIIEYALHHSVGHSSVSLEAFTSNEKAMKLYSSLGFEKVLSYTIEGSAFENEEQNFFRVSVEKILDNEQMEYTQENKTLDSVMPELRFPNEKAINEACIIYEEEPFSSR